jgi:hypothetical protein
MTGIYQKPGTGRISAFHIRLAGGTNSTGLFI